MKRQKIILRDTLIILLLFLLLLSSWPYFFWPKFSESDKEAFLNQIEYHNDHEAILISDNQEAFNIRRALFNQAENSIIISTYRFHNDETTNQLLDDLYRLADRGIKIKIITDAKFGGLVEK